MKWLFYVILFGLYMIYDMHTIGGILFRPNINGVWEFSYRSVGTFIVAPLFHCAFWVTVPLLRSNYILLFSIGCIVLYLFS